MYEIDGGHGLCVRLREHRGVDELDGHGDRDESHGDCGSVHVCDVVVVGEDADELEPVQDNGGGVVQWPAGDGRICSCDAKWTHRRQNADGNNQCSIMRPGPGMNATWM